MALGVKVIPDIKPVVAAPIDQSFPATFPVKAYLMFATAQTGWGAFAADCVLAIGGSDGTNNRGVDTFSEDNVAVSNTFRGQANKVLSILNNVGVEIAGCIHLNFTDGVGGNGVTVRWNVNDVNAYRLTIIMFGDADITNVHCGRFQVGTVIGFYDVVAPGFSPDVIFTWSSQNGNLAPVPVPPAIQANAANIAFSMNVDPFTGRLYGCGSEDGVGAGNTNHQRSITAADITYKGGIGIQDGVGSYVASLPNGFRMNQSNPASIAYNVDYLVIKGGSWALVSDGLTPAAPANVAHGGLPVQAKGAIIASHCDTTLTLGADAMFAIGAAYDDGGVKPFPQGCAWIGDEDAANPKLADQRMHNTEFIELCSPGAPPVVDEAADIHTWNPNGITIDWHTVDATARRYSVLMCGDNAPLLELPVLQSPVLAHVPISVL